jgi:predicted NUDIX family NTP pyrophosphohydrolase
MPSVRSAGLLLYRRSPQTGEVEVLLGHMGGPFWSRKDERAWSIFKGELEPGEDAETAARREFQEETGSPAPSGGLLELGEIRQRRSKTVVAWALAGDFDPGTLNSNTFEMEWPPRSGRLQQFPEMDRAGWFDADTARGKLVVGQVAFVDRLLDQLGALTPR